MRDRTQMKDGIFAIVLDIMGVFLKQVFGNEEPADVVTSPKKLFGWGVGKSEEHFSGVRHYLE